MFANTILTYPILVLLSTGKKSFQNMGRIIQRSGDTVSRLLRPAEANMEQMQHMSQQVFRHPKRLYCIIDDTLIKKCHSRFMQGSGMFFDTKIGRSIMSFRLVIGLISDGKIAIPISCAYLFSKELLEQIQEKFSSKDDIAKTIVKTAMKLFPNIEIIVTADGLYATREFISWCKSNKIKLEVRMHSNRKIVYKGRIIAVRDLVGVLGIRPKGLQMARTITAEWYGIELEITVVRRIDKHGKETIIFQAATYKTRPQMHAKAYKVRWKIEKLNRTTKQDLGLQDCYSCSLSKQYSHVSSVLLAYALAHVEAKKRRLNTPEKAIRALRQENANHTEGNLTALNQIFGECLA
jgi:SRSO17 transposase